MLPEKALCIYISQSLGSSQIPASAALNHGKLDDYLTRLRSAEANIKLQYQQYSVLKIRISYKDLEVFFLKKTAMPLGMLHPFVANEQ